MKITIEGYKDEPVVLEDVEQFVLATKEKSKVRTIVNSNTFFHAYAIVCIQRELNKIIAEKEKEDANV